MPLPSGGVLAPRFAAKICCAAIAEAAALTNVRRSKFWAEASINSIVTPEALNCQMREALVRKGAHSSRSSRDNTDSHRSLFELGMFREAEDISIGILEPGDARTGGSSPDAKRILLHPVEVVTLEVNAGFDQFVDGGDDVGHLPAEDGALRRRVLFGHPQTDHDAIGIEDKRKRRFLIEQRQSERVAIEDLGALDVDDGGEADDVVFGEACGRGHGFHHELTGLLRQEISCAVNG